MAEYRKQNIWFVMHRKELIIKKKEKHGFTFKTCFRFTIF